MGRGLSDLQKQILRYVAKHQHLHISPFIEECLGDGALWLDHLRRASASQQRLANAMVPGTLGKWTNSDIVSVSRALHRLGQRGLIMRHRGDAKRRTGYVKLTPEGQKVADASNGGNRPDSGR
jgi:DNA-binding MarR family transcriptional regulator